MGPPFSACLRVASLTKRYGPVEALRGVSFAVAPGEIFGLLGPNGAGKTTALECILGLRRPDSGQIHLGEIDALADPEGVKQLLGAQIQSAALQDLITPRQALRLFGGFYRQAVPVEVLLEQFSLGEKANAPFASLSGGQKQRLFLALAFVNQPRLLLLDEPTVGLDPRARQELHARIRQLRDDGRAVLLSTHYLDEAQQLCDRIGILDAGRIIAVGTLPELLARASALPRLLVRTMAPVPPAVLAKMPGAAPLPADAPGLVWSRAEPNQAIAAAVGCLQAGRIEITDLQIIRPSLEDVFLELTGRMYLPSGDSEEAGG